ncbi:hypothetical protein MESS4_330074 [Mesorhizobium sp. STM 4661]|nr:hypothetical protein MESS4_330074 [Mesorhizobium sp. STM 4661]
MQDTVGPMISREAAERAETAVNDAIDAGAKLLSGHRREGSLYHPTVLDGTPQTCRLWERRCSRPSLCLLPLPRSMKPSRCPMFRNTACMLVSSPTISLSHWRRQKGWRPAA